MFCVYLQSILTVSFFSPHILYLFLWCSRHNPHVLWSPCLLSVADFFLLCLFHPHVGSQGRTGVRICSLWNWLSYVFAQFQQALCALSFLSLCFQVFFFSHCEDILKTQLVEVFLLIPSLQLSYNSLWLGPEIIWHNGIQTDLILLFSPCTLSLLQTICMSSSFTLRHTCQVLLLRGLVKPLLSDSCRVNWSGV